MSHARGANILLNRLRARDAITAGTHGCFVHFMVDTSVELMTTENGTIEISHTRLPIFDTRFLGLSTPAELEAQFEEYLRVARLHGGPVVLLVDFRPVKLLRIGPARMQIAADIVRSFQTLLSPFVMAEARVFETALHRGISQTIVKMSGFGPWPIRNFARLAPAEMWLMRTLEARR